MICSMTAYVCREINDDWGSAAWKIRSTNQRYLEIYFRLPELFYNLEPIMYERIRSRLTRGKIECSLHFEVDFEKRGRLIFNKKLTKQLIDASNWIKIQSDEGKINPVDILRWPGVMVAQEQDLDEISAEILIAFEKAVDDFIVVRETEGQAIKALIEQHLEKISAEIAKVRANMPRILQWQRECLITRLKDAEIRLENDRLDQELVLMAKRTDVAEELDRLETHVKETYNILNRKEAIGRRLNFMMQELNRESNTLASKSISTDVTNSAIELKVLIEQMREHIQNIE